MTSANVRAGVLTASDFKAGTLVHGAVRGPKGETGRARPAGAAGAAGPQGLLGDASVGARPRSTGSVTATNGGSTAVPLSGNTWTQLGNELDLITGSMTEQIPSSCTGSFGNSLVVSVDGTPNMFALAPAAPAGSTVTVPFAVGTLSDPGQQAAHTVTASFANSCTKSGENYNVSNVKLDVVRVP